MRRATVWFNKNLSVTFNVLEVLRAADADRSLRIVCSHTRPDAPAGLLAGTFEVEPAGLAEADYLDYCLDFTRRHHVDLFLPGKHAAAIARDRPRFEQAGARVLTAGDGDTLALLADKVATYDVLGPEFPLPEYAGVCDRAAFDDAHARLRARHPALCIKPAVSVFGLGFHVLTDGGSALDRLLGGDPRRLGLEEARRCLAERPSFPRLLLMQYLPGPERSIDCLADRGTLLRCVVRLKPREPGGCQLLEDNPALADVAAALTRRLRLGGLFNVQFRDDHAGCPRLLEVNPRMSGGLHFACQSGFAFPYWAVRLALGTASPHDLPHPRTGGRVADVSRALAL